MQGTKNINIFFLGWREENEDEILIHTDLSDGNSIYAVFDGHGGINY